MLRFPVSKLEKLELVCEHSCPVYLSTNLQGPIENNSDLFITQIYSCLAVAEVKESRLPLCLIFNSFLQPILSSFQLFPLNLS